ncbi:acyl--CoA ligase [Parapusillimonas sp. SGNA-6]|nr:acyl--CoA ligase [Parapusillimonas sp. SGNA-6]
MEQALTPVDFFPPGTTWNDIVSAHAARHADRPALVLGDVSITYGQLKRLVDHCAEHFSRLGIRRGDCIALLSTPRPEALITFLASAKLGALWVGLNPRYQVREIHYVIDHARPTLLLSMQGFEERDYAADIDAALGDVAPEAAPRVIVYDAQDASTDALFGALALATASAGAIDAAQTDRGTEHDPCMLVYTSGTTGKPKGVLLRQRELIFRSTVQARTFVTRSHPVVINFAPINHIGGMHFRGLSQILPAGTIIYQDRYRTADVLGLIRRHQVNVLMLGSTMLQMLLEEPAFDMDVLRTMEWFIFSGSAIPMPILKKMHAHCPRIGSTYGLTESCGSVTYIQASDTLDDMAFTVGRSIPDGETRVADESGLPLPPGEQGELQLRSEYCMAGYLRDEPATRAAFTADGWLKTGDLAVARPDGTIRLVGRIKEMYKSGGYNVYPREVELVLEQHPSVMLSAVIAVDDPRYQQVGHAYLIAQPDAVLSEQELSSWCRERLANYKVPKRIHVCASLPMLSIGKVDKMALRSRQQG